MLIRILIKTDLLISFSKSMIQKPADMRPQCIVSFHTTSPYYLPIMSSHFLLMSFFVLQFSSDVSFQTSHHSKGQLKCHICVHSSDDLYLINIHIFPLVFTTLFCLFLKAFKQFISCYC